MLKFSRHRDIISLSNAKWFGGASMAVRYNKLFHMMIDKDMTNTQLKNKAGFSANIITRLKNDEYISMESIEKICEVMDCGVDNILEFVKINNNGELEVQSYVKK
jgi:DNA-binding Xre family transcriptional regulator